MPAATSAFATAWPAYATQARDSPPLAPPRPWRPPPDSSSGPAPARLLHPSLLIGQESGFSDSQRIPWQLRCAGVGRKGEGGPLLHP